MEGLVECVLICVEVCGYFELKCVLCCDEFCVEWMLVWMDCCEIGLFGEEVYGVYGDYDGGEWVLCCYSIGGFVVYV